jgi:hypothetical protein
MWSQVTWGSPWRWDPKEVFCLFTITVSLLWLGLLGGSTTAKSFSKFKNTKRASLATIAFGTVFLMIPIGSQFAASQQPHSFGGPSTTVPTMLTGIFVFFVVCLAIIWLSSLFAKEIDSEPA